MLLVVTYSRGAWDRLQNACRTHDSSVFRRFGRAALFEPTHHGAFLALRLCDKHPGDIQVERTHPFNEFADAPDTVRETARAYEARDSPSTPYSVFGVRADHPDPERMCERDLGS